MSDWPHPPYTIRTERLVLRCHEPKDAPVVRETVLRNVDYLVEWMPWVLQEPQTLDEKREVMRRFRGNFDRGTEFVYGIFTPDEEAFVGSAGLHPRCGPGGLEVGYWIAQEHAGRGYASEAAAALTQAAFSILGADRVEIRIEPANKRSHAIPKRLEFRREAELRRRLQWPGREPRDLTLWTLFRSEYPGTPSAAATLEFYDALKQVMTPRPEAAE